MQNEKIICPQCKSIFSNFEIGINKDHGQNYLQTSCPECGYVFKQKKSWSQLSRVIAIIVLIPTSMFLLVALQIFLQDSSLLADSIYAYFVPVILVFGLAFWAKRHEMKKNNPHFVLGEKFEKYKSEAAVKNVENENEKIEYKPTNDPLMDKIRMESVRKFKEQLPEQEKKKTTHERIWRKVTVFLAVAFVLIASMLKFLELTRDLNESNNEMREHIIENRAQNILNIIKLKGMSSYPKELPREMISSLGNVFREENIKMDKKYFGETIDIDDFTYLSNGNSFSLCIKESLGGKCWKN